MKGLKLKPWLPLLVLLIVLGFARGFSAEGTFTLEQVLSAPYPTNLVSAKSADRIAWVFNSEGARNVWTAAGPDFTPVNLTRYVKDEVFQIPSLGITGDGLTVVYVRGGDPNSRGWVTNPASDPAGVEQAIWAVRTDGGNPWRVCAGTRPALSPDGRWILVVRDDLIYRVALCDPSPSGQVAEPELLFKAAGRNGSPAWSPDQTRVAFVSSREDHSFVGVYDLARRKITWLAPSVDRDSEPAWSPDGKRVAFFRRPGAQYKEVFDYFNPPLPAIWVADAETGAGKELWGPPAAEPKYYTIRNLMWTARDRILFTAEHDEWNHVFSLAPAGGGEPEDLTPGDGMVEQLSLSSDGGTLFYSSNQADIHGRHIFKVATAGGGKPVALTKGPTIGCYPVALASGKEVAFLSATARQPLSVALVPAAGGKTQTVAPRALPEKFPMDNLVVPELVIVKAADGLEIPCQLFLPKGAKPGDRRPGVVFTHGGPIRQMLLGWHYMEFYAEAYGINQYFANRGFVVISINYRSGIGYGRRFRMPPDSGRRGASEYQDLVAGAKYLQARPEVDPEGVGLWGLSYGGYLTAMGLARNSDIFKAGVDLAGVHDWSARPRDPRPGAAQGMSAEDLKLAFDSSPVAGVNTWKSPVLFIHGDDDRNVDFSQTVDLVQKLRAKGDVHVELMVRPDEPHEFMLRKNRLDAYNATFEFLNRFLGKK